jgi:hypothetical protein
LRQDVSGIFWAEKNLPGFFESVLTQSTDKRTIQPSGRMLRTGTLTQGSET